MTLIEKLQEVFPYARSIEILVPEEDDGQFVAELRIPCKAGETTVQLYRLPPQYTDADVRHEDKLSWRDAGAHRTEDGAVVPKHKTAFGNARWEFLASWDGVALYAEIRTLVEKRLASHPLFGGGMK